MEDLSAPHDKTVPQLCRDVVAYLEKGQVTDALTSARDLESALNKISDPTSVELTYVQSYMTRAWNMLVGRAGDEVEKLRELLEDIYPHMQLAQMSSQGLRKEDGQDFFYDKAYGRGEMFSLVISTGSEPFELRTRDFTGSMGSQDLSSPPSHIPSR